MRLFQCAFWRALVGIALFVAISGATPASAGLFYDVRFGQDIYEATPGSQVSVDVFFRETATGASIPRVAPGGLNGIFSLGAGVRFESTTGVSPARILQPDDILLGPLLSDVFFQQREVLSDTEARFQGFSADFIAGVETAPIASGVHEFRFATLNFTAGTEIGEVTQLTLQDFDVTADSVSVDFTVLDDLIRFGDATIEVVSGNQVVPEPATGAASIVFISILALRRRGRTRVVNQ
ncbi:MAG: hypothetical protein AAFU85_07045 [Planctomycetota bacterium]